MMASVRKKCWSTMRSKGTTSNIFPEQTDIEEARTYEEVVADGCQDTHGRDILLIWTSQ